MKRWITTVIAICMLCAFFAGCSGEYNSVEPYQEQAQQDASETLKVSNYDELHQILEEMIHSTVTEGVITAESFAQETAMQSMEKAILQLTTQDPYGAFVVSKITYGIGKNGADTQIAVDISYRKTAAEIAAIQNAPDMDTVYSHIKQALDNCDAGLVIIAQKYSDTDFVQFVNDYANLCPDKVMEIPQVSVTAYPDAGEQRMIELVFTYQTGRETLRMMQSEVAKKFNSAVNYPTETENAYNRAKQLYSWLMSRGEYTIAQSITPAYSLLCHTTGDSRAFANVYAAMCRRVGICCEVVSGMRDSDPWCWNKITLDGVEYYIDINRCAETGGFKLLAQSEMIGYVGHGVAYPSAILEI